jgi:membrane associated rhomboid family serine protease
VAGAWLTRGPGRSRRRGSGFGFGEDERRRCTDILLATNVTAFAAQLLSRGALLAWGAKASARALAAGVADGAHALTPLCARAQVNQLISAGQFWRLLTPALLHGGVVHLFVNCYSLNDLGPAAEALLGPRRFACFYAASAVSGNVASYLMNPGPGVGASGAIFGLVGCLAVYFARHRHLHGRAGELKLQCAPGARLLCACMHGR